MEILETLEQWTDEWLKMRAGKISGTKLWNIMGWPAAQETQMFELLAEEVAPLEETFKNAAMQRGNDLEPDAIKRFEDDTWADIFQPGLISKNEYHILSPDGVEYDDWVIKKALEVKCLAAKKQLKYMTVESFKDVYKIDKSYYWQVVNYFLVIDTLEELSFMLYNPDMYDDHRQSFVIKVTREELAKDIEKAKERIHSFKIEWDRNKELLLID